MLNSTRSTIREKIKSPSEKTNSNPGGSLRKLKVSNCILSRRTASRNYSSGTLGQRRSLKNIALSRRNTFAECALKANTSIKIISKVKTLIGPMKGKDSQSGSTQR